MINYKVTNLDDKTDEKKRTKLTTNLKAMKGIETVKLHPSRSEISLSFQGKVPEASVIEKVVSSSGFKLGEVRK